MLIFDGPETSKVVIQPDGSRPVQVTLEGNRFGWQMSGA